MNENKNRNHAPSALTTEQAERVLHRYYEGLTSAQEEQLLRRFLLSPEAADSRFDEHRAVFAYMATARARHQAALHADKTSRTTASPLPRTTAPRPGNALRLHILPIAASATLLIALGSGLYLYRQATQENCIALVEGKKYTSKEVVRDQMMQAMTTVLERESSVEEQLSDMFSELSESPTDKPEI